MASKDAVFLSPHKFAGGPGTPGRAGRQARAPAPAGAVGAGRRHGRVRRPDGTELPPGARRCGRRRARRRSSSRSAPGWCSRSRRRSAPRRSTGARTRSRGARSRRGARTRTSGSSATRSSSGSRSCRSASGTRAGCCTPNFVVALLSDLFGIQARSGCFCAGPYIHRMYPIDPAWSAAMHADAVRGRPGREARVRPHQLQLLHQRDGLRLHRRGGPPDRERGLEAAAAVPLRCDHRPVAARDSATGGGALARGPGIRRPAPDGARGRARRPARRGAADHGGGRDPPAAARIEAAAIRPAPLVPAPGRGVRPGRSA